MVEIWLKSSAQPLKREGVKNVYEKGSYTCIQLEDTVEKYPTADVFRVVEPYASVKPCEGNPQKKESFIGIVGTRVIIGSAQAVKTDMVENMARVKLSAKGREYVGVLLQLTSDLESIAASIVDLAEYFELSEV